MTGEPQQHDPLDGVGFSRRQLIQRIVVGSAFALPVVTSFDMSSLGVSSAYANNANQFPSSGPSFSSSNAVVFPVGRHGSFTIVTPGNAPIALSMSGKLPEGVQFSPIPDNFDDTNDDSGTLSGTPHAGTVGAYELTFHATNGILPNATQAFTLLVGEHPAFTSRHAATIKTGERARIEIATSDYPAATITAGKLPPGMRLTGDRMRGTAVLAGRPPASAVGVHHFTLTAANGVSPEARQKFALTVRR